MLSGLTGESAIRLMESKIRAGKTLLYPLSKFEIQRNYRNEIRLYDTYGKHILPKAKNGKSMRCCICKK